MTKTYVIHSVDAIHRDIARVPDVGGLYAFMLKDPDALNAPLERAGLAMDVMGMGEQPLLYIGASADSLRRRIRCHLRDDTQASTFRQSLGALLAEPLSLEIKPVAYKKVFGFTPSSEARLTQWMGQHLLVGVLPAPKPLELERRTIRTEDPMLNIVGRRMRDGAWAVMLLRRRCVDQTLVEV